MYNEHRSSQKKDYNQAWSAIQKYCAYQERCHKEVRTKLYGFGLHKDDVEELLYRLIENNFLNEERFAKAYAGGKFRVKKWGKIRILQELKRREISDFCIRKAMKEIPDEAYYQTLVELVEKKMKTYASGNAYERNRKVAAYCYGRGFESDLIWEIIKSKDV